MNKVNIAITILSIYLLSMVYCFLIILKESVKGKAKLLKRLFFGTLLFISPLIVGFFILSRTNYLDYEKPLTYDRYESITFDNFRGFEFFKKSLYGSKTFAYVVTSIEYEIEDNTVSVYSLFHPSKSFVYKKNIQSPDLLSHEKYHIKVTELFTRIAKKRLSTIENYTTENVDLLIEKIKKEEQKYQKAYDYDTFHSYVLSEQKRYEKEIDSLLETLHEYKLPKIQIHEQH